MSGFEITNHVLSMVLIAATAGVALWLWVQGEVGVGAVVDSRFAFGAWAAAVASGTVWLGALANWAQGAVFRRHAAEARLSPDAAARLFRAARDADHWIEVLKACGQRPSHAELASFVRHVDEATRG